MAWEDRSIEKIAKKRLQEDHGSFGEVCYSRYVEARRMVTEDILPQIKAIEPNLTDHGPSHVSDVLLRVGCLLGEKCLKEIIPSLDLYALLISVLFHDVGNIFKRENHQQKVGEVLKEVWPNRVDFRGEHNIVRKVAMAHCGKASDGSFDTLKDVEENIIYKSHQVNLQEVASITRFADELAEGPQRTSQFLIEKGFISDGSIPYHHYASQTEVGIDRDSGRIALSYEIEIDTEEIQWENKITKSLELIYFRIGKLDQERQYAKYYCSKYLSPFIKTTASLNFIINECESTLDLDKIVLTDLTIPGDKRKAIAETDLNYRTENIISSIQKRIK